MVVCIVEPYGKACNGVTVDRRFCHFHGLELLFGTCNIVELYEEEWEGKGESAYRSIQTKYIRQSRTGAEDNIICRMVLELTCKRPGLPSASNIISKSISNLGATAASTNPFTPSLIKPGRDGGKSRLLTEIRILRSYNFCNSFVSSSAKMAAPSATRNRPPPSVAFWKQTKAA